jgi:hypothetical protein
MRWTSVISLAATIFTTSLAATRDNNKSEVPSIRSYFYVGGGYVSDGAGGEVFRDQMYVERLLPVEGAKKETPIVFIHGQAQTGTVSNPYQYSNLS